LRAVRGAHGRAAAQRALAFAKLLDEYDVISDLLEQRPSPYATRRTIGDIYSGFQNLPQDEEARWAAESVLNLRDAVRVLALGLDYRRFRRFQRVTPEVYGFRDERYKLANTSRIPTIEEYKQALQFVVECALQVQD